MKALARRLHALEGPQPREICPSLKRWLGIPLRAAETIEADRADAERGPFDRGEVENNSNISQEAKAWLLR